MATQMAKVRIGDFTVIAILYFTLQNSIPVMQLSHQWHYESCICSMYSKKKVHIKTDFLKKFNSVVT